MSDNSNGRPERNEMSDNSNGRSERNEMSDNSNSLVTREVSEFTAIDILQAMKEELFESGWCQGLFVNGNGEVCLLGAHRNAAWRLVGNGAWTDIDRTRQGRYAAEDLICEVVGPVYTIPQWNDTPGRTFDEVIDVIDQATILGKEKGHNG